MIRTAFFVALAVLVMQARAQDFCNANPVPALPVSIPGFNSEMPLDYFNFFLGQNIPLSVQRYVERESDFYYDLLIRSKLENGFDFAPVIHLLIFLF
tara:strand:+ start:102 stop:392 length:291 start_codon:yes stop_codon:yes gene_type:complete